MILASAATAATFDRGLIPKETPSSGTSAGQQFTGDISIVFDEYDPTVGSASAFDAVVRLRKGNETHVFYTAFDCASEDPAHPNLCVLDGKLVVSSQVAIQMYIEDAIEPQVIADFHLSNVAVRLKDVTDPAGKPYAPALFVFGANIEVTAK